MILIFLELALVIAAIGAVMMGGAILAYLIFDLANGRSNHVRTNERSSGRRG